LSLCFRAAAAKPGWLSASIAASMRSADQYALSACSVVGLWPTAFVPASIAAGVRSGVELATGVAPTGEPGATATFFVAAPACAAGKTANPATARRVRMVFKRIDISERAYSSPD